MVKPWETDLSLYDDEPALLAGLRRKDRLACTCLLKRFAPPLYRLAWQLTGDPDEAEDVLQDAFIQACAHIAEFEGRSGLETWLHRIVVNTALARLRRKSLVTVPLDLDHVPVPEDVQEALVDQRAGPGEAVLTRELGDELARAILALPDSLRAAYVLRDIEGLNTREAAVALGLDESALKVRLHRAHVALRNSLRGSVTAVDPALPEALEQRLLDQLCPPATSRATPQG